MWQRIQSLILALAAVMAIVFLFVPAAEFESDIFIPKTDIASASLSIAIALLALFTIYMYKNRRLQMNLCKLNIFLTALLFIWTCIAATQNDEYIQFKLGAGIPVLGIICFVLAHRFIHKDDELVKSMDRIR